MRAVSVVKHGAPEVLKYGDAVHPEPQPGQVRINVGL